jgi:hypothetical protein
MNRLRAELGLVAIGGARATEEKGDCRVVEGRYSPAGEWQLPVNDANLQRLLVVERADDDVE